MSQERALPTPAIVDGLATPLRYQQYREYKNSGVPWIGTVPVHWRIQPLKRFGKLNGGAGFPHEYQGVLDQEFPFFKVGDMAVPSNSTFMREHLHTISNETAIHLRAKVLPPKTIVFAKVGAALLLNRRRILIQPSCIDNNMMGFTLSDGDAAWFFYRLSDFDFGRIANPGAVPSLNEGQLGEIVIAAPPETEEQQKIAAFLDRETARIDELIAKKQRLIELLAEKRTALISHAVTKGLNPDAPMKDSGVEWLGQIPVHWFSFPVKRVAKRIQTGCTPPTSNKEYYENGTIPWYGPSSFSSEIRLSKPVKLINKLALTDRVARLFEAGSTLIVTIGATIGKVGFIEQPSSSNQQITSVTPDFRRAEGRFITYQLKCLEEFMRGSSPNTTLPIMDQQATGMLPLALPSRNEQSRIVLYLEEQTKRIKIVNNLVTKAIEKMCEYRSALISAAVTGKIDVRKEM